MQSQSSQSPRNPSNNHILTANLRPSIYQYSIPNMVSLNTLPLQTMQPYILWVPTTNTATTANSIQHQNHNNNNNHNNNHRQSHLPQTNQNPNPYHANISNTHSNSVHLLNASFSSLPPLNDAKPISTGYSTINMINTHNNTNMHNIHKTNINNINIDKKLYNVIKEWYPYDAKELSQEFKQHHNRDTIIAFLTNKTKNEQMNYLDSFVSMLENRTNSNNNHSSLLNLTFEHPEQECKTFTLYNISNLCTISDIERMIIDHCNNNHNDNDNKIKFGPIRLCLNKDRNGHLSYTLYSHKTLNEYRIENGQTLYIDTQIKLIIKYGQKMPYLVSIFTSTKIGELRKQISKHYKIQNNTRFWLSHSNNDNKGKYGLYNRTISHYKIQNHQTLYVSTYIKLYIIDDSRMIRKEMYVSSTAFISDIKRKIISDDSYHVSSMSFKLCIEKECDKGLNEEDTLQNINIDHHDSLYISREITLIIKYPDDKNNDSNHDDNCYYLNMNSSSTIGKVKEYIIAHYRINHNIQFRLVMYKNKDLLFHSDLTIEQYEIRDGEIFYIQIQQQTTTNNISKYFDDLLIEQDINDNTNQLFINIKKQWNETCESYKMVSIWRINKNFQRNMEIYNAVIASTRESKKESNKNNHIKERVLFHGTSLENLKSIIINGFNRDHNIRSVYGKGTYFSNLGNVAAAYCHTFGSQKQYRALLACKVYIGDSTVGRNNMNESALYRQDKVTQYDSLVDSINNPKIFVINRDYHAVACYVIIFTQ